MLIAHAPAGYLVTRMVCWFCRKINLRKWEDILNKPVVLIAGITGAILPDIDFIYHSFIDSDRTPHHSYWTHMPFFWLLVWGTAFLIGRWRKQPLFIAAASMLCLNALFHLTLDTLTGVIYWFYPLSHHGFNIFKVPGTRIWWVHQFMRHWTFLIEIGIVSAAMLLYIKPKEAIDDLRKVFTEHPRLRMLSFRMVVCCFGIALIAVVGSMRFSLDNKLFAKALKLKQMVSHTLKGS
jgi:inner membrane protein